MAASRYQVELVTRPQVYMEILNGLDKAFDIAVRKELWSIAAEVSIAMKVLKSVYKAEDLTDFSTLMGN